MAWGSKVDLSPDLTTVNDTGQAFATFISLADNEKIECQFGATMSGGTDDAIFELHDTLDDSSEQFSDTPIAGTRVPGASGVAKYRGLVVSGPYRFRVWARSSGSTDTFTATCSYRIGKK